VLDAYSAGVNEGLAALDAPPFEYLLLRQEPSRWLPEDSLLVAGAMYFDLQDADARFERNAIVARSVLPEPIADLLYPATTAWDSPMIGRPGPPATVPTSDVYDLRELPPTLFSESPRQRVPGAIDLTQTIPGSNSWAVGRARAANGAAVLASDPHLSLRVPSLWFRVSLARDGRRVTGASLPGIPAVIFGSNGNVAWGFTNSYGDWTDLVVIDIDGDDPTRYRTSEGWRSFETVSSPIAIAGAAPEPFEIRATIYGPVVGSLPDGRPYAVHWVAHDVEGYDVSGMLDALMAARDTRSAIDVAQRIGMPEQNIVVADRGGSIGWTIAGPIPRRLGPADAATPGETPTFSGWLAPAEFPAIIDPDDSLIWTANARVVDGDMLARIGVGNYALGARATQIRGRLGRLSGATPTDMLSIQLDDEAQFLSHWSDALLRLLDGEDDPLLRAVREEVAASSDRADVDSVGYRVVRGWRKLMIERMLAALAAEVIAVDPTWTYASFRAEHVGWALVSAEPVHLLDPRFGSWREFELDVLDEYLSSDLPVASPATLRERTWGERNQVRVRHPLSAALPLLSRWLDMPTAGLPGDVLVPRVQTPEFGASARFAVSPGDEAHGYFEMPGGQSGHPLSPYYGAGHDDWVHGVASPFLPGDAEHSLELVPPDSTSQ